MLSQKEILKLEDFLIWHTQKENSVWAFDEVDYWAFYFDKYRKDDRWRKGFQNIKKGKSILIYSSAPIQ